LDNALNEVGFNTVLDLNRPVSSFSGGEQMRLMWASALLQKPDILIFDEPSNHLDAQGRERFTNWLANAREQIILVSHDRALLDHVDAIYELTPIALHRHAGNFSEYMASQQQRWQKQSTDLNLARREEKQTKTRAQEALEKQQQRVSRGKAASKNRGDPKWLRDYFKNAAERTQGNQKKLRMNREQASASTLEHAYQAKEWFDPIGFALPTSFVSPSKLVLSTQALQWGVENPLCKPLTTSLKGAFRLHITGANGAGKSILLKTLMKHLNPLAGHANVHVPFAYLDQHAYASSPSLTAIETLLVKQPDLTDNEGRERLACLRLRNEKGNVRFGDLSGGEQLKVILASALLSKETPQLLLLDEPTNHLDLDSIVALENALTTFEGAMIIVSHDTQFVSRFDLTHRLFLPEAELVLL
jgi:ATPase subunit of ABC transporter with duplicated ATPase domains